MTWPRPNFELRVALIAALFLSLTLEVASAPPRPVARAPGRSPTVAVSPTPKPSPGVYSPSSPPAKAPQVNSSRIRLKVSYEKVGAFVLSVNSRIADTQIQPEVTLVWPKNPEISFEEVPAPSPRPGRLRVAKLKIPLEISGRRPGWSLVFRKRTYGGSDASRGTLKATITFNQEGEVTQEEIVLVGPKGQVWKQKFQTVAPGYLDWVRYSPAKNVSARARRFELDFFIGGGGAIYTDIVNSEITQSQWSSLLPVGTVSGQFNFTAESAWMARAFIHGSLQARLPDSPYSPWMEFALNVGRSALTSARLDPSQKFHWGASLASTYERFSQATPNQTATLDATTFVLRTQSLIWADLSADIALNLLPWPTRLLLNGSVLAYGVSTSSGTTPIDGAFTALQSFRWSVRLEQSLFGFMAAGTEVRGWSLTSDAIQSRGIRILGFAGIRLAF